MTLEPGNTDAAGAEAWLDEHGDALFAYAYRRLRNRDQAEDLVQETLLAALSADASYQRASSRRSWLIGILKHKLIDHWRRQRETAASQADGSEDDEPASEPWFDRRGMWRRDHRPGRWSPEPDALAEDAEFWSVFDGCLNELPTRQSWAFTLRELEQVSSDDACDVLQVKPTNLSVLLHRARTALRHCLERRWFAPAATQAGPDVRKDAS